MNRSKYAVSLLAVLVLASTALAATPQRKTGGGVDAKATPATEMKAGGKPRLFVATSAETNETWANPVTRQALENALVNSGRFEVIAGAQRDNLLKEQGFANSDVVSPTDSVKVGQMLAAKYVVSGTCQSVTTDSTSTGGIGGAVGGRFGMGGNKELSSKVVAKVQIQLLDLEKGTVVLSREYEEKGGESTMGTKNSTNKEEAAYRDIITRVAARFVAELGDSVPIEALVALVEGNRVALTAGGAAGVKPGMKFEVFAEGEAIKHPVTGKVISRKTYKYAVLVVESVEDELAWASIKRTFDDAGTEDAVPNPGRVSAEMSARSMSGPAGAAAGDAGGGGKKKKDKPQD